MEDAKVFEIFRSRKGYTEKPDIKGARSLNFQRENLIKGVKEGKFIPYKSNLKDVYTWVSNGYTINGSVTDTTQLLILDFDNGETMGTFAEKCRKWDIYPNIFYQTFSHKPDHHKFRAIYKLDKPYKLADYKNIYKLMMYIFPTLDPAMKNFKQLVHGTNKTSKLIHFNVFDPVKVAERVGYKPQEDKETKVYTKQKSGEHSKNKYLNLEGVLMHFQIYTKSWGYDEGRHIYLTLRDFGLDTSLSFNTQQGGGIDYLSDYERAYKSGHKPAIGSIGAKLYGALSTVIDPIK